MWEFEHISRTAKADISQPTPQSRHVPKKLTVPHLAKEITAFHAARRFMVAFTKACHLFLSWVSRTQSTPSHLIPLTSSSFFFFFFFSSSSSSSSSGITVLGGSSPLSKSILSLCSNPRLGLPRVSRPFRFSQQNPEYNAHTGCLYT